MKTHHSLSKDITIAFISLLIPNITYYGITIIRNFILGDGDSIQMVKETNLDKVCKLLKINIFIKVNLKMEKETDMES